MFYELSPDELKQLLDFVNDEKTFTLPLDLSQKFSNIFFAFQSKVMKCAKAERARTVRAEAEALRWRQRYEKKSEEEPLPPVTEMPEEQQVSEAAAARCIMYLLQEKHVYYTRNLIQYYMYHAYCSWLSRNNQHLFKTHPVCQEWGPHFWSAVDAIGIPERERPNLNWTALRAVQEANPGVANYLENMVNMYCGVRESDFKARLLESFPYKNALPERNEGKWNGVINDDDIRRWMPKPKKQ